MKKIIKLGVAVLLVGTVLCACGEKETEKAGGSAGEPAETVEEFAQTAPEQTGETVPAEDKEKEEDSRPQPPAEAKVEELVGEQFRFIGQIGSEEWGYRIDANYAVPKLLPDTDAARAINEEIRLYCLDVIEPTRYEQDYPSWDSVSYDAFLNGGIVSLVIEKGGAVADGAGYAVFNYNAKDDRVVDNEELLSLCGYTEQSFAEAMRKTVACESDSFLCYTFESYYWDSGDMTEEDRQARYAEHMRCRQNSIAADRVNSEMPMYLDEAGRLQVITEIDVPAGNGFYVAILTPRTESGAKDFAFDFEDSLFVTYRDGSLTIRIEEGDWTSNTFGGNGSYLEFGREYRVEGAYKDYVDGAMLFVEDGEYAIPVFVSEDGMVSALNIYACAYAGYFCLTEPVMGLTGIEAVTETNGDRIAEDVGRTLLGQCGGFAKNALGVYGIEGYQKIYAYDREEDAIFGDYIGFDEDEAGTFLYQQYPVGLCYSGECVFLGMNEEGLIFSARICAEESLDTTDYYSAFSLKKDTRWNEEIDDLEFWATFRDLSGFRLFNGGDELIVLDVING